MPTTRYRLIVAAAGAVVATIGIIAILAWLRPLGADEPAHRVAGSATTLPETGTGALESPRAPASSPAPRPAEGRLLPDLQSLPPEDVHIEVIGDGRRLRFTSIIANVGVGPVETVPDDALPCPDDQRHASQVVYHDVDGDGRFDREVDTHTSARPAGCMLDHRGHDHWHFDAAARYALLPIDDATPVAEADKVSFCWRDSREVPAEADPRPDQFYGDCSYDTVQGITPGWADVYPEDLDDQHLDLPDDLVDGEYCLWNEADPLGLLAETSEDNNAAVVAIQIAGTDVSAAPGTECG